MSFVLNAVKEEYFQEDMNIIAGFHGEYINKSSLKVQLELRRTAAKPLGFETLPEFLFLDFISLSQKFNHLHAIPLSEVIEIVKLMLVLSAKNTTS